MFRKHDDGFSHEKTEGACFEAFEAVVGKRARDETSETPPRGGGEGSVSGCPRGVIVSVSSRAWRARSRGVLPPARSRARAGRRAVDFLRFSRKDAMVRIRARSRRRVRSRPTERGPRRDGASENREKWLETRWRIRARCEVGGEETDLARRMRHAKAELGARHRTVHDVKLAAVRPSVTEPLSGNGTFAEPRYALAWTRVRVTRAVPRRGRASCGLCAETHFKSKRTRLSQTVSCFFFVLRLRCARITVYC